MNGTSLFLGGVALLAVLGVGYVLISRQNGPVYQRPPAPAAVPPREPNATDYINAGANAVNAFANAYSAVDG
jgi:hypothetical protein